MRGLIKSSHPRTDRGSPWRKPFLGWKGGAVPTEGTMTEVEASKSVLSMKLIKDSGIPAARNARAFDSGLTES